MPRKKLTEEEKQKQKLGWEYEDIQRRLSHIPEPAYLFNVGDSVRIGCLRDVVIKEVCENGKFYKIEYSIEHNNYGNPYLETGIESYREWYKLRPFSKATESLIQNDDVRLQFYNTSIESLFSKSYYFGVEMNPEYQRDYVWDETDKLKLIDSIFHNIDIGKFCFIHNGHSSEEMYEILDGKQRMRAILDFYENRFAYKGMYFNDLCPKDQSWFENFSISVAEVEKTDQKTVLKYFLMLNDTGKKMSQEHIQKVTDLTILYKSSNIMQQPRTMCGAVLILKGVVMEK